MTDNGPAKVRFNAGLRGCKGTVYEGGIRVPCFIRWPARLPGGTGRGSAGGPHRHLPDLAGSLPASTCRAGLPLDGKSLMPLLRGGSGRGVARSDAVLPVASRRRARAGPRLRRPLAALQAPPPRAPAREAEAPQAGALRPGERPGRGAQHRRRAPRDRRADARGLPRLVPRRVLDARVRPRPDRDRRSRGRIRPC